VPAVEPSNSISIPEAGTVAPPAAPAPPAPPAAPADVCTAADADVCTAADPSITIDGATATKPATIISEISPHDPEAFMEDEEEEATPTDVIAKKTN
jgi:hypothetical protein